MMNHIKQLLLGVGILGAFLGSIALLMTYEIFAYFLIGLAYLYLCWLVGGLTLAWRRRP